MLKRYQVLLNDWMEDYIKFVAEKYDISISSEIRIHMALGIIYVISTLNPEYKVNLESKEFMELTKKAGKGELEEYEVHQMMSKVLFEARKAAEHRMALEKKTKKK